MSGMRSALLMPEHSACLGVMQLAYPAVMTNGSPRQERRREKLRQLVKENGGQALVAAEVGTPKSHISAILAGRRGIGDELAHKIERRFELPPGWFDESDATYWPFSSELQKETLLLKDEELARLETVMRAHLGLSSQKLTVVGTSSHRMSTELGTDGHTDPRGVAPDPLKDAADLSVPGRDERSKKNRRPAR